MIAQRRFLFWLLLFITIAGSGLVVSGIWQLINAPYIGDVPVFMELALLSVVVMPWAVKLPSGAAWRPGVPLMMVGMFLIRPQFIVLVPLLGLILITAQARAVWWKYFQTIAHVALGLYAGTWTYIEFTHLIPQTWYMAVPVALVPALLVHLLVNRIVAAIIVCQREQRPFFGQLRLSLRELHWGYINIYLSVLVTSLLRTNVTVIGILLIALIQLGIFLAVSRYNQLERLQQSARMDGLTRLENRTAWEKFRDHETIHLKQGRLAVIDVNDFKDINDKYGHLVGDDVLRGIAHVIDAALPFESRRFRIGGDEFVAFLSASAEQDFVSSVRKGVHQLNEAMSHVVESISVSIGIAAYPEDGRTLDELFRMADARMYDEKRAVRYTQSGLEFGIPASIMSLILATESRDAYVSGHNLRVAYYAWQLAIQMGVSPELLKSIFRGGLVHDVGKIGIPDAILNKPGKLSPDEYEMVKRHPETGFEMCRKLGFAKDELDVVRHHHERWDGSGYPLSLSGHAIPLAARIAAVADVYDALTSARSYREAWSHQGAMAYLVDNRDRYFDPACVDAWAKLNQHGAVQRDQFGAWVKETNWVSEVSVSSMV